jgi:hypothetical protein
MACGPQIGCSIDPPQLRQVTLAVSDIRAIVECAPQFGHSDRSSKRRRQETQRYRPGRLVPRSHGSPQDGHLGPSLVFSLATVTLRSPE